ncbi:MAG: sugar ABC transporter substrate-binding protein [Propionibacterium sp.]|nr:sugar ABC transporter substrate-binding protein [Propionibacterium sp.]
MFRRNITRFSALLAVGALALGSACAPGETIEEPDDTDNGTQAPAEPPAVEEGQFAGETLNYLYFTDGPDEQATRDLIADFEAEYDVTVELEILAYADLISSLNARLSGGNAPDVVRLTGLGEFAADLLPLEDYLGAEFADEFLEGPMMAVRNNADQMIAVPSDLTMNGPLVNLEMFEEAGVELPPTDDPWTWDEMLAAAHEVQEATGSSYAFAMDKSGHRVATVLAQYGTALLNDDGWALDKEAAVRALQPLIDMMADDTMPRDFWLGSGSRYEGANEIFLASDTPIYLSGSWQVGQFVENATFDWGVAPNPCDVECGGFPGGKFMAALSASDNPALAAEFVRFMNSTENQEHFASVSGNLPTRVDLAEAGVSYPAEAQAAMDVFIADLNRTAEVGFVANAQPAFGASGTALTGQLDMVVAGQKDLATAMDDLQPEVEGIVEEMGSW